MTDNTKTILPHILLLIGFLSVIAGFFLSWGVYKYNTGFASWEQQAYTGVNAGWQGYLMIGFGVIGFLIALASLFNSIQSKLAMLIIRLICLFGVMSLLFGFFYLSNFSSSEGKLIKFPFGPAVAIVGYIINLIAGFFVIKNHSQNAS